MKVVIFLIVTFYLAQADICQINDDCPGVGEVPRICRKKVGDSDGECVFGCLSDSDCPLPLIADPSTNNEKRICSDGICVAGCITDDEGDSENCPSEDKPRCNTNFNVAGTDSHAGQCDVICRSNEDCRLAAAEIDDPEIQYNYLLHLICLKPTGKPSFCGTCKTNADCVDFRGPICSDGLCVSCTKDTDCRSHPSGKVCKLSGNDDFPEEKNCGCVSDADCTGKQFGNVCHLESGLCSCLEDTDCKVKGFGKCSDNGFHVEGSENNIKVCSPCNADDDCSSKNGVSTCNKMFLTSKCALSDCSLSPLGTRVMGQDLCGCRFDSDCVETINNPVTPACDCAASKCVACTRDSHCKSFERCNDAKKCAPLKCQSDFDCFRKDLIELGIERTEEARCSDSLTCVAKAPVCIDSKLAPSVAAKKTTTLPYSNLKTVSKIIKKQK